MLCTLDQFDTVALNLLLILARSGNKYFVQPFFTDQSGRNWAIGASPNDRRRSTVIELIPEDSHRGQSTSGIRQGSNAEPTVTITSGDGRDLMATPKLPRGYDAIDIGHMEYIRDDRHPRFLFHQRKVTGLPNYDLLMDDWISTMALNLPVMHAQFVAFLMEIASQPRDLGLWFF